MIPAGDRIAFAVYRIGLSPGEFSFRGGQQALMRYVPYHLPVPVPT
jgi:hypothetical protein